jgi:hypothetical protein
MAVGIIKLETWWQALLVAIFFTSSCATGVAQPVVEAPSYEDALQALGLPPKADGDLDTAWEYYLFLQSDACGGGVDELCELYERTAIDAYIASELQKFVGQVREESRPFGLEYREFSESEQVIKASDDSWLQGTLARITWFDISTYGADADKAAFILVQHSNNTEWQAQALELMRAAQLQGGTDPRNIALLHDRIAIRKGEPQRYATQGNCSGAGSWAPSETEDFGTVDSRRAEMGLAPLSDYVEQMEAMCGG